MQRDRKVQVSSDGVSSFVAPGSLVRAYANRKNWPLSIRNVMLEGRTDAEYFRIANGKHHAHNSRRLICDSLSLFQVGDGASGGVDNIKDKFVYLREVLSTDTSDVSDQRIMVIVLMDNDRAGRETARFLDRRGFKTHRDVFLIARKIPRETRDAYQLNRLIVEANAAWEHIDCEVEDLLSLDLLKYFAEMEPSSLAKEPQIVADGHHFEWTDDGKARLLNFVKREASLVDVVGIVELLKSLRFLLSLDPNGI